MGLFFFLIVCFRVSDDFHRGYNPAVDNVPQLFHGGSCHLTYRDRTIPIVGDGHRTRAPLRKQPPSASSNNSNSKRSGERQIQQEHRRLRGLEWCWEEWTKGGNSYSPEECPTATLVMSIFRLIKIRDNSITFFNNCRRLTVWVVAIKSNQN